MTSTLPKLSRVAHAAHCTRTLVGLPFSYATVDASRVAIGFYCFGTLDLLGLLDSKTRESEREGWREWLWDQQTSGKYGSGFRPSSYMTPENRQDIVTEKYHEYDMPHLIMTYTAILSLAILRDEMKQLDRQGIIKFIGSCQREDGSFTSFPGSAESDLRQVYCAFAISSMLNDWSGIDLNRAIAYIQRCSSHEGGYGQQPTGEALGGTTYCALASLYLAPAAQGLPASQNPYISPIERQRTIRWLLQTQTQQGGFCGRTNKDADACYCFWNGASLHMMGAGHLVDSGALAAFLAKCQFKFGGICKAPEDKPDPYHTYLSLAVLSLFPPPEGDDTWKLSPLNAQWNCTSETEKWIIDHIQEGQGNTA
ncbi:terpenoid cyclases/Protein prenyltransferase [Panus rudis PR-1116 ss-1]|nr:terpenoid cyclases/Protein prenyltransferase [Panus rudis PR-1116 ss-1]